MLVDGHFIPENNDSHISNALLNEQPPKRSSFIKKGRCRCQKCNNLCSMVSLYTIPNGIFHKGTNSFNAGIGSFGTFIFVFLASAYLVFTIKDVNIMIGLNSY